MLVIVKSSPDTPEGKRGVRLAAEMTADIVLLQNGVYFLDGQRLEDLGFYRTAYAIKDDVRLRGLKLASPRHEIVDYDGLVDLMTGSEKVVGMF